MTDPSFPMAAPVPAVSPPRRRAGMWAGLALGLAIALCAGGGTAAYFLVQNVQPDGPESLQEAVDGFLGAVFHDHDPDKAGQYVCQRARSRTDLRKLVDKVREVERQYRAPRTTWETESVQTGDHQATARVTLTLTTADDRVAHRDVRLQLIDKRGWWVCDAEAIN